MLPPPKGSRDDFGTDDHTVRVRRHRHETEPSIERSTTVSRRIDDDRSNGRTRLTCLDDPKQRIYEEDSAQPASLLSSIKRELRNERCGNWIGHAPTDPCWRIPARDRVRAQCVVADDTAVVIEPHEGARNTRASRGFCVVSKPVVQRLVAGVEMGRVVSMRIEPAAGLVGVSPHCERTSCTPRPPRATQVLALGPVHRRTCRRTPPTSRCTGTS